MVLNGCNDMSLASFAKIFTHIVRKNYYGVPSRGVTLEVNINSSTLELPQGTDAAIPDTEGKKLQLRTLLKEGCNCNFCNYTVINKKLRSSYLFWGARGVVRCLLGYKDAQNSIVARRFFAVEAKRYFVRVYQKPYPFLVLFLNVTADKFLPVQKRPLFGTLFWATMSRGCTLWLSFNLWKIFHTLFTLAISGQFNGLAAFSNNSFLPTGRRSARTCPRAPAGQYLFIRCCPGRGQHN